MRAWTYTRRGSPAEVLTLDPDFPRPSPSSLKPNEVIVKVHYISVFQGVAAIMSILPHFNSNPWIPEHDCSGIVDAVGSDVTSLMVGDAVFAGAFSRSYNGMAAEYIKLPAEAVVKKPGNVSLQSVGGIAGNGCTAIPLVDVANLGPGSRVLVTGGSSAIGSILVQACRAAIGESGYLVVTCSGENVDFVRSLGADEVVDYKKHPVLHDFLLDWPAEASFDAIFDVVGVDDLLYEHSPAYLKPEGCFLFAGNIKIVHGGGGLLSMIAWVLGIKIRQVRPVVLGGVPRRCWFHSGTMNIETLEKLRRLIENGKVKGTVDSVWDMEDLVKAYEKVATGHARGKVLVRIQEE